MGKKQKYKKNKAHSFWHLGNEGNTKVIIIINIKVVI
jgi:hypothetical protein